MSPRHPKPTSPASTSLSIVVPAYNEERRLAGTLKRIAAYLIESRWSDVEVIVVNDGSTDGTANVVEEYRSRTSVPLRLLHNPGNRGKGYAVRHGMLRARGDWILYSDADLSAPIEEFEGMFEAALDKSAAVVIGSRALDRSLIDVHQPFVRELAGRAFNTVMRVVTGLPFRDTQCGFKLYSATAARSIFIAQMLDGFGFDVEDLFIARQLGFRVIEWPVRWSDREGTKVSLAKGAKSFLEVLQIRYWHRSGGKRLPARNVDELCGSESHAARGAMR